MQIALGWVWILDGLLQFQPSMFGRGFVTNILLPNAQGQPAPLAWSITTMGHFVLPDVGVWDFLFGSIQLLIGVGLLFRRTVKPAIVVMAVWAFGVWWFGEGFGQLFMAMASPLTGAPGAVLLYPVIGFLVWPTGRGRDEDAIGIASSPGASGPLGVSAALAAWSGFWTLSAFLWLLPANRAEGAIGSQIAGAGAGEPAWYAHLLTALAANIGPHATFISWELALASLVIGLGPLLCRRPTAFLVIGMALELAYWVTGMSLGAVMTGSGTDPNAGPLVALLAIALIPTVAAVPTEAPLRTILARHPIGVGATSAAVFALLLLGSTYPVGAAASSAPASTPSQATSSMSMAMSTMHSGPTSRHASSMNMAAMAGLGVTDPTWKYTGPPLPAAEVAELTTVSARTDVGHKMQTPNCTIAPTPDQVLGAVRYVQSTSAAVAKYQDLSVAKAEGYIPVTNPSYPVVHYVNPAYLNASDLMNPNTVDSLVYATTPYGPVLVAAMYLMPGPGDGPMPYGCLVQWHQHTNLCTNDVTHQIDGFTPCGPGTYHHGSTPMMTHVWQVPVAGGPLAIDPSDLQVVEAAIMAQQEGLAPTTDGPVPTPAGAAAGSTS
ncbi:MAG: hypothetical protein ACLPVF_04335 [Acidimicrobiales bacterium]